MGSFGFPLGVYPIEPMKPKPGYVMEFEAADGDNSGGEWEEWPDRYMFDIVVPATRLEALCRRLFSLLPGRVYPIIDLLGRDAYREVDPYISYELLGFDRFMDALRRYRPFFFEDGLCGFGAMCDEPFIYMFVDEHKIITVRVEPQHRETVERILESFDLEAVSDPAGADSAAHEHRSILLMPHDEPEVLGPDEIVEVLRDEWHMLLNIDPETNIDDEGHELGITSWRCIVRCDPPNNAPSRYAEIVLDADRLRVAEEAALDAVDMLSEKAEELWEDVVIVAADRLDPEDAKRLLDTIPPTPQALPRLPGPSRALPPAQTAAESQPASGESTSPRNPPAAEAQARPTETETAPELPKLPTPPTPDRPRSSRGSRGTKGGPTLGRSRLEAAGAETGPPDDDDEDNLGDDDDFSAEADDAEPELPAAPAVVHRARWLDDGHTRDTE